MKITTHLYLSATLATLLTSCMNPTVAIESDIKAFSKEHPDQIQSFQSQNRIMQYAWSGDPNQRALIFVHGSPGSWDGWSHFLRQPELQKNFHLIAIDRPGYGGSTPGKTERSLRLQADDILEVLQFNKSKLPAILIGHSYGGPVIAQAAIAYPKKIAGLIFVAASVDPKLEENKWYQYPANWWPIKHLIPTDLRVCNEEIMALKDELKSLLPNWKLITAKTVVIQGLDDSLVPPANVDFLESHIAPKLILKTFREPKTNHFIPWKRPDLILIGIREVQNALK